MSSTHRALLENLVRRQGRQADRTLRREELEEWIDQLLRQRGEDGLNAIRDAAREVASDLNCLAEMRELDRILSGALLTRDDIAFESTALQARTARLPYDPDRMRLFADLVSVLRDLPPDVVPDLPAHASRSRLLPFYEAYFSNFIEGTEFSVDEAAEIVFSGRVPDNRPQDAHDVLGTYEIVADATEMATVPRSGAGLAELLLARHAVLMGSRPDKRPGEFKARANRAGLTHFVAPDLVKGTLMRAFDLAEDLISPFARAVYLMFLVAEVHPFEDGNGRIARIMMNAELVSQGEVRIIIPTVYRANYLAALKGATHGGHFAGLASVLAYARRYAARVDFSSRTTAEGDLGRTNAFHDALDAESRGIRLTLP